MINTMESRYFYYLGLPIVLFLVVPGFMINENLNDLWFLDTSVLIFLAGTVLIGLVATLFMVGFSIGNIRLRSYFSDFIRFVFFYVLIAGLFVPVSLSSEMIDPQSNPVNVVNIIIAIIISLLVFILSFSKIKTFVFTGVFSILVMSIFIAAYGIFSLKEANEVDSKSIFEVSNKKNIFVISFDGIPRDIAVEAIKKSQIFQRDFVDFVVFENVISSSPATTASISAELYGNQDFKNKLQNSNELWLVNPDLLITNYLDMHGFNVSTLCCTYSLGFKNKKRTIVPRKLFDLSLNGRVIDILNFYDYVFVRVGTQYTVRVINKFYRVSGFYAVIDRITSFFEKNDSSSLDTKVNHSYGKKWDRKLILHKMAYDGYVKSLTVSGSNKIAHFLHFPHTHFPVDFDSECKFKSDDQKWHNTHQNRKGVESEVHCALSQMTSFIKRLKDLGIYDQSLIVFKSDHGKPASYHNQNNIESFRIRNHIHWGYGRYTPLLLIKNFHSNFKEINYNQAAVMLDDLAKTLCINSGIDADCSVYPGFDLLSDNLEVPETASSVIFIVKNKSSNHEFTSHEALYLKRKKDFYKNINSALISEFLSTSLVCGSKINFDNSKRFNNGFSDYKSWVTWKSNNSYFINFNLEQCPLGIKLLLELKNFYEGDTDFKVFVNDKINPVGLQKTKSEGDELLSNANYQISIQPEFLDESGSILIQVSPVIEDVKVILSFVGINFEE